MRVCVVLTGALLAPAAAAVTIAGTGIVLPSDDPSTWSAATDLQIVDDTVTVAPGDFVDLHGVATSDNGGAGGTLQMQGGTLRAADQVRIGSQGKGNLRFDGGGALLLTPTLLVGAGLDGDGAAVLNDTNAVLRGAAATQTGGNNVLGGFRYDLDMAVGAGENASGLLQVFAGDVIGSHLAVGTGTSGASGGTGTVLVTGPAARLFLTPSGSSGFSTMPGTLALGGEDGGGGTVAVNNRGQIQIINELAGLALPAIDLSGDASAPSRLQVNDAGARLDSFSAGYNAVSVNGTGAGGAEVSVSDGGVLALNRTNGAGPGTHAVLAIGTLEGRSGALRVARNGAVNLFADDAAVFLAQDMSLGDGGTSAIVELTAGGSLTVSGAHAARLLAGGTALAVPDAPVLRVDGANSLLQVLAGGAAAGVATFDVSPRAGSLEVTAGGRIAVDGAQESILRLGKVASAGLALVDASGLWAGSAGSTAATFEHHGGNLWIRNGSGVVVEATDSALFRSVGAGLQVNASALEVRGAAHSRMALGSDGPVAVVDPMFIGAGSTVSITGSASAAFEVGGEAATAGNASAGAAWLSGPFNLVRVVAPVASAAVGTNATPGSSAGLRIDNGARLEVEGAGAARMDIGTAAGSNGQVTVAGAGSVLSVRDLATGTGELRLGRAGGGASGVLRLEDGRVAADTVTVMGGGRIEGNGTLEIAPSQRVVLAGGIIAPGLSPGRIVIAGDFLLADGVLEIEVAGTGAGQFDVLDVTGDAFFTGGLLRVLFAGGFVPGVGDSFEFLRAGGRLDVSRGLRYQVAGLPAALDARFDVSGGGFTLTALAVDPPTGVPEPAALALLATAMAIAGLARRRRSAEIDCKA